MELTIIFVAIVITTESTAPLASVPADAAASEAVLTAPVAKSEALSFAVLALSKTVLPRLDVASFTSEAFSSAFFFMSLNIFAYDQFYY